MIRRNLLTPLYWILSLTVLGLATWLMLMPDPVVPQPKREADGKGVEITSFSGRNKKQIRIWATRQRNTDDRNCYFDQFRAEITPDSPDGEIINAYATEAYLFNNSHNIELRGDVRVESKSLLLKGPYLLLKDQKHLSSEEEISYFLRQVSGSAHKGLRYNMQKEVIKLFAVRGLMEREDGRFLYQCRELTLYRAEHRLHFLDQVVIDGAGRRLSCQRLAIDFDREMKEVSAALAVGKVRVTAQPPEAGQQGNRYTIKSGRMQGLYEQGLLQKAEYREGVAITIVTPSGELSSKSDVLLMTMDPQSGAVREIEIPVSGEWSMKRGKRGFAVRADQGRLLFDAQGELVSSEGKGKVVFRIDDFTGEGDQLVYRPGKNSAVVSGEGSWIKKESQLFHGKSLSLDTAANELSSSDGVVSSISLKGRPPFQADPVMIHAQTVHLQDRRNRIQYKGRVRVSQRKLNLGCEMLQVSDDGIEAEKDVVFRFEDNERPVLLRGGKLSIVGRKKPQITITEKANLIIDNNQILAETLVMEWGEGQAGIDSVRGQKAVEFEGSGYQTRSDNLFWNLQKEMMRFTGEVTIKKGKDFESKGEEVELDTKTQQLRILTRSGRKE